MIASLPIHNLVQAAAQMLILACLGAILPALFRIEHPRSNLWWLQCVLWACLLLPWIEPQQHPVIVLSRISAPAAHVARAIPAHVSSTAIDWDHIILGLLLAGAAARLLWLGVGMFHIRRCRIAATPLYRCRQPSGARNRSPAPPHSSASRPASNPRRRSESSAPSYSS
jgi:hypothetical protein